MKKITLNLITAAFLLFLGNVSLFAQTSAAYTVTNNQGCAPLTVTFTNTTTDPNAYRIEWHFSDGGPVYRDTVPFEAAFTRTFSNPGNYSNMQANVFSTSNYIGNAYIGNSFIQVNGVGINAPDTVCIGDITGLCTSGQGVNSAFWNFGDGGTANQPCPTHSFNNAVNNVTLVATSGQCGSQTSTKTIYGSTTAGPHPNAWTNNNSSCPGSPISFFTNTYASYNWIFGDGGTSNLQNPQHSYTTTGPHTATLIVTNGCQKTATTTTTVNISANPPWPNYPQFSLQNPSSACPNSTVSFNAPNGYNSYQWNFGDNSPIVTTSTNYNNHTFGGAIQNYTVSVKINKGCPNDTTLYSVLQINTNAPFPNGLNFNVSSPSCPNSNVSFNGPDGFLSYKWNFGDGSPVITSSNNHINHMYGSNITTYNVSLTITNTCQNTNTLTNTVVISSTSTFPNPGPNFQIWAQSPICPNGNVNFNAPDGYQSYVWNFDDGTPSVTTNTNHVNHLFGNAIGTDTVTVKITNGCQAFTTLTTYIVIKSDAGFPQNSSDFQLRLSSPACPNSNVSFQGPWGYVSYLWHFGDGSPDVTTSQYSYNHTYGPAITSYSVSVKVTNGCNHDSLITGTVQIMSGVGFPNNSQFQVSAGPNPACSGDQVSFNAPQGYSNYKWKFGDGDSAMSNQNYANHVYALDGPYTYSVKIKNACSKDTTIYGSITVGSNGVFSSWLSIDMNPATGSCPGDLVGLRVNGGGFHSYFWDFGDSTTVTSNGENIQHAFDTLGTYYVSCKVKNGCGDSTTVYGAVHVVGNSPISADLAVQGVQNPSCPGDKVSFLISQGQSTNQYIWNYGDGSPADTTIGAGGKHIYTTIGTKIVTVTAKNACGSTKTITMIQTVDTTNVPSLMGHDGKKNWGYPGSENNNGIGTAGCAGDAIVFFFMGDAGNNVWNFGDGNSGTATEHIVVDGGDGSAMPVTIIKHVYALNDTYNVSLTFTNHCGNSVTDSMKIIVGGNQAVDGQLMTSPPPFTTCAPINFIAFGGASYAWNFGDGATLSSPSPTVSHTFAAQGVYVVTVLITNGCGNTATYSLSVNVNGAGGPAITLSSSTNPTCVGGSNGKAVISVANGQQPYSYLWNDPNAQTSDTVTNLAPGVYYATVTDNIGCASTFAVSIGNPAPIVLAAASTQSSCGLATGTATIAVTSGGASPYSYLWTNGGTNASATGLHFGLYSVAVTDHNGCSISSNVSISELNTAAITLNTVTNVVCNGNSNGAIDINLTGGTAPFDYAWSNGATTQDLTGLIGGTYSVIVTDAGLCHSTFNAVVGQADSLSVITSVLNVPTCGNHDGSAKASVTGGTSPYSYLWSSGTNSTTNIVSGLFAGTYTVTVTDSHTCSTVREISLSNSNAPVITETITDVTCNGLINGAIDVTVNGGTSPYSYTWSVGSPQTNHEDLTGLASGNYVLFVRDAMQCAAVRIYNVAQPAVLTVSAASTGTTCNHSDGFAAASPIGGNTSYSYLWTGGGQTNQTAAGLAVGSYTVTVTDNKGCTASASSSIAQVTPKPSICMVTVDELSVNNIIYWDKTPFTSVDSFIVYREVSTNIYKRIGAVAYDSLSEFIDNNRNVGPANGDPNIGAYRYKLQIRDLCGDLSALSPYHNTIYIAGPDNNGNFDWNLPYAIEGSDPNVSNYRLFCDTLNSNWFEVGAVAGTQANVADAGYISHNSHPLTGWYVQTDWTTTCTPTRSSINTSRSNIKRPGITTGITKVSGADAAVTIYPNPAKDYVTIELSSSPKNIQLKIVNVLGQTVYKETIIASSGKTVKQINTSNFAKGVYSVVIETNTSKILKKLVVN